MALARSDAEVEQKFVTIVEDFLGARRTRRALDQLWKLDEIDDVNGIAPLFARDAVQGREESACVV
jgi:hypothetical protein